MNNRALLTSVKRHRWAKTITRPYSVFFLSNHVRTYCLELPAFVGVGFTNYIYLSRDGLTSIYRTTSQVKKFDNRLVHLLTHDRDRVREMMNEIQQARQTVRRMVRLKRRKGPMSVQAFEQHHNFFAWLFVRLTTVPFYFGAIIDRRLNNTKYNQSILRTLMAYRREDLYTTYVNTFLKSPLRTFARKLHIPQSEIEQLTFKEIMGGLNGKSIPTKIERDRRRKQFAYITLNGREHIVSQKGFTDTTDQFIAEKVDKDTRQLKGVAAYRGYSEGRVRIIQHPRDMKAFKKGDILVSTATNPIHLPAIRKAAAIVTDEGGMMCHAAILSRELKTPCVIGTKIATQVFTNGEYVKVDAIRGIVTKR